ncbi:MAG TPA: UDP-3-O-(3-hydroxymyristoyl)glucosamine N-acyltransferase [Chitinophagaceae bacterium]|nr:UDP-3-O-(3-hydroxymyristoyl)glucosamine N-acyltransferase [Chitinophagaceae bacterium]
MKFKEAIALEWLNSFIQADKILKNEPLLFDKALGINEIHKVEPGDITFVDHPKYFKKAVESAASFIIINKEYAAIPPGKQLWVHPKPFEVYNNLIKLLRNDSTFSNPKDIPKSTQVLPGAIIGDDVEIGENCIIYPNVTIMGKVRIGDRVVIHANTVIGSDAFYFKRYTDRDLQYEQMHSGGEVVIESDVFIGAACTIDRGVSGKTVIGTGSKLDNQVHIGHGVVIGKNCLIAAQVGIAGKTTLEDNVTLWGQVGVNKDLTIGKDAVVYAQSGVPKSIEGGKVYFGSPVEEAKIKMKEMAWVKRIPNLWEKIMNKEKDN